MFALCYSFITPGKLYRKVLNTESTDFIVGKLLTTANYYSDIALHPITMGASTSYIDNMINAMNTM